MSEQIDLYYGDYEEIRERINFLREKFGYLVNFTPEQIVVLKNKIEEFKRVDAFNFKKSIFIPEGLNIDLEKYNIDTNNIASFSKTNIVKGIINEELDRISLLEKELNNVIDSSQVLKLTSIKNTVINKMILNEEELELLSSCCNKDIVIELKEMIKNYNSGFILNKKLLKNDIIHLQKKLLMDLENKIDSICFKLNIDYKDKFIAQKYLDIKNVLNQKRIILKEVINEVNKMGLNFKNVEKGFSLYMEKFGIKINLSYDEIEELSKYDIDELLEDIKNTSLSYHINKEKNRRFNI